MCLLPGGLRCERGGRTEGQAPPKPQRTSGAELGLHVGLHRGAETRAQRQTHRGTDRLSQRPREREPGRDPKGEGKQAEIHRKKCTGRGNRDRYTQRDRDDLALEETEIRTHRGRTADTKRPPPPHTQELER